MTSMYIEITISNTSKSLYEKGKKFIRLLGWKYTIALIGDIKRNGEIRTTSELCLISRRFKTPYVEEVSNMLCDTLAPIANELTAFIKDNECRIWIYFVVSLDEEGIAISINERLLKLASLLNSPIHFDGL